MTVSIADMMDALVERGFIERPSDGKPKRPNRLIYTRTYSAYTSAFEAPPQKRDSLNAELERGAEGDQR